MKVDYIHLKKNTHNFTGQSYLKMYIHVDNNWVHIQNFRGDSETFLYLGHGGVNYLNQYQFMMCLLESSFVKTRNIR